jgi:hypothetical protein
VPWWWALFVVLPTLQLRICKIEALWGSCWLFWPHPGFLYNIAGFFWPPWLSGNIVWVMVTPKYMSNYHLATAVLYTNTTVVGVRLWGIHMLCVCGVEVFPMVNFRPIDSGYLCKYNQSNRRYCPRALSPLGSGLCQKGSLPVWQGAIGVYHP